MVSQKIREISHHYSEPVRLAQDKLSKQSDIIETLRRFVPQNDILLAFYESINVDKFVKSQVFPILSFPT